MDTGCEPENQFDGRLNLRISAIFAIFISGLLGATFPVISENKGLKTPRAVLFAARYFGSGVILATAFIHLLSPAQDALNNPCLTGPITEYSWVEGILLMTIMTFLFVDLLARRFTPSSGRPSSQLVGPSQPGVRSSSPPILPYHKKTGPVQDTSGPAVFDLRKSTEGVAQLTGVFILEFGIVFHSVFVGLSLAVSGSEFITLYVVLVFHQCFEGVGLGTRLATSLLPHLGARVTYGFVALFALATPVAIAIGLAVRSTFEPGSASGLITTGVLYSISAGILIYTSLVELIAGEFLFAGTLTNASNSTVGAAFGCMCLGAGLMALLGKWA